MGTFDTVQRREYTQPAWIFRSGSATYDALTISHEVGHNFGLKHHGTSTSGYYSGAGSWIPIMGVAPSGASRSGRPGSTPTRTTRTRTTWP